MFFSTLLRVYIYIYNDKLCFFSVESKRLHLLGKTLFNHNKSQWNDYHSIWKVLYEVFKTIMVSHSTVRTVFVYPPAVVLWIIILDSQTRRQDIIPVWKMKCASFFSAHITIKRWICYKCGWVHNKSCNLKIISQCNFRLKCF